MHYLSRALVSLCNLRTVLVIIAGILISGMRLPDWYQSGADALDRALLRVAVDVSDLPVPNAHVTVIHVPDIEYDSWLADLAGAKGLLDLLNLVHQNADDQHVVTGLVLERPLSLIQTQSESILKLVMENKSSKNRVVNKRITEALAQRGELIDLLSRGSVVLGLQNQLPVGQDTIDTYYDAPVEEPAWFVNVMRVFSSHIWPLGGDTQLPLLNPRPVLNHYPVVDNDSHVSFLVQNTPADKVVSSFVMSFILASNLEENRLQSLKEAGAASDVSKFDINWKRGDALDLAGKPLRIAYDGSIVPIYGEAPGLRTGLKQLTLAAAMRAENLDGWILIGRDQSALMGQAAQILAAIGDDAYLQKPAWFPLYSMLLVLGILLYFLSIVPRLRYITAVGITVAVVVFLALSQLLAHYFYQYWWPSGEIILWTLVGFVIITLWLKQHARIELLYRRADEVSLQHAKNLIKSHAYEPALMNLSACRTSDELLEILYALGEQCRENSNPELALASFQQIKKRKRRYKDTADKLKLLEVESKEKQNEKERKEEAEEQTQANAETLRREDDLAKTVAIDMAEEVNALQGRTLGRYELKREVGRGAMGTVYLGYDPKIARNVAIKTLNYRQFPKDNLQESKERFYKEAEAAGRLNHSSIVQVFDIGEEDDIAYIAMDFANGVSLSEFTKAENLLPPYKVYKIIADVADALSYAHNQNIVHRDIKPGNIIVDVNTCSVKVTDFGIARLIDNSQTQTGEILGSPLYMAPEQLKGRKVNHAADIFSLGVTFYQLLSGHLPFKGDNLANLTYEIINSKHASVRSFKDDLPFSAARITNKALSKNISERYPSAGVMARVIRKAIKRDFATEAKEAGFVE